LFVAPKMNARVRLFDKNSAVSVGLLRPGEKAVITAGIPMGVAGSTNLIKAAVAP